MSDPRAKAEQSAVKDARQIPAPDKPSTGRKRKSRKNPWRVEIKFPMFGWCAVCRGSEYDARYIYNRELRGGWRNLPVRLLNSDRAIVATTETGGE